MTRRAEVIRPTVRNRFDNELVRTPVANQRRRARSASKPDLPSSPSRREQVAAPEARPVAAALDSASDGELTGRAWSGDLFAA